MSRKALVSLLLLVFLGLLVCETASALPRRRRRNNNNYYSYNYTYSSGYTQIAAKSDSDTWDYRRLDVYCDYEAAQSEDAALADRIRVSMNVWDQEILSSEEPLVAEVKITNTSDDETSYVQQVPVTLTEVADEQYQVGTFELSNPVEGEAIIHPATVYRLFVTLHRQSDKYDETTAWGRLPGPYYVVTSGDSVLEKARHQIVMRTFREWYYTERGWNRNAAYPMDCHAFYRWATGPSTVGASNGWANLGAIFGVYHDGSQIAGLMEADKIHGDYVRLPGHTFMLLSYDAKRGQVLTMEANFNSTIEICIRSVGYGWTVGHLEPDHIRADLFEEAPAADLVADSGEASDDGEAIARAETLKTGEEESTATQ